MSDNHGFGNLATFWDYRSGAIVRAGRRLAQQTQAERECTLRSLSEDVVDQVGDLDDGWLAATSMFMVEDLYKSYFCGFYWTPTIVDYLRATAGVFVSEMERRGFVLHYVIDNTVLEADLQAMFTDIPLIFQTAGMVTTGPPLAALEIFHRRDGSQPDPAEILSILAEGRKLADDLVGQFHADRRSSVYLNLEFDDGSPGHSLDAALSQASAPGTIVVFRDAPPIIVAEAQIALPPGLGLPVF